MEVKFGTTVYCRDGVGGKISHVLINQRSWKVSFLVVNQSQRSGDDRIIPLQFLESSTNNEVRLSCTLAQLQQFERFTILDQPTESLVEAAERIGGASAYSYAMLEASRHLPPELNIPSGYQVLYWGTQVGAEDGQVGRIHAIHYEPRHNMLSSLVIHQGYLWFKKEFAIPARTIERIEPEFVQLNVDRCQVQAMLAVRPHRS